MSSYPFPFCLEPKIVTDKDGNKVLSSCGACSACLNKRSNRNQRLCEMEEKGSYCYSYFCTLTYDDDHLPYYEIQHVEGNKYNLLDCCQTSLTCGEYLFDEDEPIYISERDMRIIREKVDIPYPNSIGYLNYRDVQLFNKSFRKEIKKYTHAKIRYFAVGEYGGETLRPHWHIIYFSDAPLPREINEELVRKIWKRAYKVDFARCKGGAVGYSSSYINSATALPFVYKDAKISTKSAHSVKLGGQFVQNTLVPKISENLVHEENRSVPIRQHYEINGHVKNLPMDKTFQNSLFPKPFRYEHIKRNKQLLGYLRVFAHYEKYLGRELTVKDLTRKIYDYLLSFPCDHSVYNDHYTDYDRGFMEYIDFPRTWFHLVNAMDVEDIRRMYFDRLYRIILYSKNYIDRCNSDKNYLANLHNYYDKQEYQLLVAQYQTQVEYFSQNDTDDISPFYDNCFSLSKLKETMLYSSFATEQEMKHHKKLKRKKMNDLVRTLEPKKK